MAFSVPRARAEIGSASVPRLFEGVCSLDRLGVLPTVDDRASGFASLGMQQGESMRMRMRMRKVTSGAVTLLLVAGVVGFAGSASATFYGTFVDPSPSATVSYENVADVNGLFGAPTVSLNSLDFTPTSYDAICSF